MKRLKKIFITVVANIMIMSAAHTQAVVSVPVLEAIQTSSLIQQYSGFLTAIDTLYANYDMIVNTITQIENQYKSIQQAIERAKSIEWETIIIEDFDIRDDIKDANKYINSQLTQARKIKSALTTDVIRLPGGVGYSIADLCGMGEDEKKDFRTAVSDVYGYMSDNMKTAADAAIHGLSYEEGKAIQAKYGISPANYWYVVQTENQLKTAVSNGIAWAMDVTGRLSDEQEEAEKRSVIYKAAEATVDSDENMTEGATSEGTFRMLGFLSEQLSKIKTIMRESIGLQSNKIMQELAEKEAKAATEYEQSKLEEYKDSQVPGFFATKAKPYYDD